MPLCLERGFLFRDTSIVSRLFQAPSAAQITFTNNATTSLNLALAGILQPGDHVITTMLEHHAVADLFTCLRKNEAFQ